MATLVGSDQVYGESVTSAVTPTGVSCLAGDVITLVLPIASGTAPSSVTSSLDGAMTTECDYNFNFRVMIFRLVVVTAGTHTVTVNYGAADDITGFMDVWRGLATTGLPDAETAGSTGTGTSVDHGTLAISAAGLILTCARLGGGAASVTPASGFTLTDIAVRAVRQYKLTSGAETPSNVVVPDASVTWDAIGVAYVNGTSARKIILTRPA